MCIRDRRQRAGAADDEIGSRQQLRHVVDVFFYHKALARGKALFFFQILEQLHAVLTGGMQVEHRLCILLFRCV